MRDQARTERPVLSLPSEACVAAFPGLVAGLGVSILYGQGLWEDKKLFQCGNARLLSAQGLEAAWPDPETYSS